MINNLDLVSYFIMFFLSILFFVCVLRELVCQLARTFHPESPTPCYDKVRRSGGVSQSEFSICKLNLDADLHIVALSVSKVETLPEVVSAYVLLGSVYGCFQIISVCECCFNRSHFV